MLVLCCRHGDVLPLSLVVVYSPPLKKNQAQDLDFLTFSVQLASMQHRTFCRT